MLLELESEGYSVPQLLPANFIDCEDKKEAYKMLLIYSSIYAYTSEAGLMEFIEIEELDFDDILQEIDIPNLKLDLNEPDEINEDEILEIEEVAITRIGDYFVIDDRHKLICGDAKSTNIYKILFDNEDQDYPDMVNTDPPYGISYINYRDDIIYKPIIGDEADFDMGGVFNAVKSPIWYVWGADYLFPSLPNFNDGSMDTWIKRFKEVQNKLFTSGFEMCWRYPALNNRALYRVPINNSSEFLKEHPTQKPLSLSRLAIKESITEDQIVMDMFIGSGGTLIVAQETNTRCFGVDLEPLYIDLTLRRYKKQYPEAQIECVNRDDYDFRKLFSKSVI